MATNVRMDPVALARLLRGPDGPVVKDLLRRANLVKHEAQRLAPVGQSAPGRSRSPGTLRNSIVVRILSRGGDPIAQVGSDDKVALFVHEGTEPHLIEGRPLLAFHSAKAGKVVIVPRVQHPGTKPNRFLIEALSVLGR